MDRDIVNKHIEDYLPAAQKGDINAIALVMRMYAKLHDSLNIEYWGNELFNIKQYDLLDNYNKQIVEVKIELGYYYNVARKGKELPKDEIANLIIKAYNDNNKDVAITLWQTIKECHNARAERVMGLIMMDERKYAEAYEFMILAIEHGYMACIDAAGYCLLQLNKSDLANKLFEIGYSYHDDCMCAYNLANSFLLGRGCEKDVDRALELYHNIRLRKGAHQPLTFKALILWYGDVRNFPHDYYKACNYADEYLEQGYIEGRAFKGYCIANGIGTAYSPEIGWAMVSYAAAKGDQTAKKMLFLKGVDKTTNTVANKLGDLLAHGLISMF